MSSSYYDRGWSYMKRDGPAYAPQKGIKEFREGADDGCSLCMWALGVVFEQGHGVSKDLNQAERWYEMSAKLGLNEAQYSLGSLLHGLGRYEEAFEWFTLAAADKHDLGLLGVGISRHRGLGCQVDLGKAEKAYLEARSLGVEEATLQLAILYAERGDKSNIIRARNIAAESNEPDTARLWLLQRNLIMLLEKSSTPTQEALEAAMHAADMGNVDTCEWCGELLARGTTGLVDNDKAHRYLDIAIAAGRTRAMLSKAIMLINGQGILTDQQEARELIEKAASMGDEYANDMVEKYYSEK